LAAISAWAQNSLGGKVIDAESGKPLIGASVWTEKLGIGTVTDEKGEFTLAKLPAGELELRVSFLGFEAYRQVISVPYAGNLEIELVSRALLTEEFIVSSTRASDLTPTTFTNVDKSQIARRNLGQDIPILLQYTPSVVSYSDAGAGV